MTSLKIVKEVDILAEMVDQVRNLKTKAEAAKNEFETAQSYLLTLMEDREVFEVDSGEWHATRVQGRSTKIDDEALMNWVNQNKPELISDLMKYVMDRKQLELAISRDKIPMTVVNNCVTTQMIKPYLRITERQMDPDAQ